MPTQVLNISQREVADSSGNISFTFGPVPTSLSWQGAVTISGDGAVKATWQAAVAGIIWANWLGQAASTVIQAAQGLSITITGTGITPSAPVVATLIGSSSDFATTTPVAPSPNMMAALIADLVAAETQPITSPAGPFTLAANTSQFVSVPTFAQSATIVVASLSAILSVTGTLTNIYLPWTPLSTSPLSNSNSMVSFAVVPPIDPAIEVLAFPTPGPASCTFSVLFSSAPPVPLPAPQSLTLGAVRQNTLTPLTLLSPSAQGVFRIQQVTMVTSGGPASGDFYGADLEATLLITNASGSLLAAAAAGLTAVGGTISPNVLTYPGTTLTFTPSGPATPNGQVNVNIVYQQLIP